MKDKETLMGKLTRLALCVVVGVIFLPALGWAQGSITGAVKDASGAVLPGVTVEVASPALIEKTRVVVTDGTGQYRLVDLRPGTYAVTFSLSGFSTLKREGIELTGSFTATVNGDLRVGTITETITVTGESPIVDVQGVTQQKVIGADIIAALPTGRSPVSLTVLIPGISAAVSAAGNGNAMDVGGVGALSNTYMTVHGSSYLDQRLSVDGIQVRNILGQGNANNFAPDMSSAQEVAIEIAAGSVEQFTGGVRVNIVPREGGNAFKGSFFGTGANASFQAKNITQELKDRGLNDPNALSKQYDINPSFGGPILRDKLWFYSGARWQSNENYLAGMYENVNAGDPTKWTYVADLSRQAKFATTDKSVNTRLTWQAAQKQKVNLYWHEARRFWQDARPNFSPEAFSQTRFPVKHLGMASWLSPLTSRLFVEARGSTFADSMTNAIEPHLIRVVDQGGLYPGITYRGISNSRTEQPNIWELQATLTYVTGAHALKIGVSRSGGIIRNVSSEQGPLPTDHVDYRFNNGVPNQLTQRASPNERASGIRELGLFVQDKWTIHRLTLNGGLRFDHLGTFFPQQTIGPALLAPTRNITFQETSWNSLSDLSPRLGATFDLFGNGKTAIKVSLSKYLAGYGASSGNPVAGLSQSTTRTWTDSNRNFVPDCDLVNPLLNAECGPMANRLFGQGVASTTDAPDIVKGWGKRLTNSEFSASVQHELRPRIAVNVGMFRRWYGNFTVVDNLATTASDYSVFSVTAPVNPLLPGGGGYVIDGLYNLNPNKVGQVNNQENFASNYGDQTQQWTGMDASVNVRFRRGLTLQTGLTSGRTLTDNCEVMAKLPEIQARGYEILSLDRRAVSAGLTNNPFCRVQTAFLTQFKGLGAYTIPRANVLVAATFQSFPGVELLANYLASNAQVAPSLGRSLSGGAANVTVPLVSPGTQYGDRASMVDLRVGKILSFGRLRTTANFDVYNLFNANTVTATNNQYQTWLRPQAIIGGRLLKFSVQVDF